MDNICDKVEIGSRMSGKAAMIAVGALIKPVFVPFCYVPQIECSSISEYSEKIIKSNHLHNGKSYTTYQSCI